VAAATTLAACSQSNQDAPSADAAGTNAAAPAAARDPCKLVANAESVLGQPVSARHNTNPSGTLDCQWKSAEGRLCGSLTVFGAGYNEVGDAKVNYEAMATSLKAFGQTLDVAGVGEEAKAVDGGMLGAQLAFRKGNHAVLVASACKSGGNGPTVLAEKLAREVAAQL
jgi:hypothetical protein